MLLLVVLHSLFVNVELPVREQCVFHGTLGVLRTESGDDEIGLEVDLLA